MTTIVAVEPPHALHLSEPQAVNGRKQVKSEPHHVSTVINYYRDPGDGSPPAPVIVSDKTVKNERPTIAHKTIVHDITGEEDEYSLDKNGFLFHRRPTRCDDFWSDGVVEAEYYPESEQLLKDVTGASRALIFDHKTRCGPSDWHKLGENNRIARGPLLRAHVDQSYRGAEIVLRKYLPDEADELLKRRYQIINIWRPLRQVFKDPLAVADSRSIPDSDLVAAAIIFGPTGELRDETWAIKPPSAPRNHINTTQTGEGGNDGGGHRWYFKYAQRPDEVLLIKCFDSSSSPEGIARRAPHSAFEDAAEKDKEFRESIEARALVFYD